MVIHLFAGLSVSRTRFIALLESVKEDMRSLCIANYNILFLAPQFDVYLLEKTVWEPHEYIFCDSLGKRGIFLLFLRILKKNVYTYYPQKNGKSLKLWIACQIK